MTAEDRLNKLATDPRLRQVGWDGYRARPLGDAAIEAAMRFLRYPTAVVPTMCGGVQLEWHSKDVTMELTFDSDGTPLSLVGWARTDDGGLGKDLTVD